MSDARRWTARARAGDTEAQAFYSSLFSADDLCWLCDAEIGPGVSISTFADPQKPEGAIMSRICHGCFSLPQAVQLKREMAMIRAIFPSSVWNGWRTASKKKAARSSV
jgi:hypothetical protein